MAKIQSSRAKIYETKANFADEPTQHVESEGEKLIKQMVQKQLDTRLNFQEQFSQTKDFQSSTEIVPLNSYTTGQISLKDFQNTAKRANYIEELKSCGLSSDEIELLLDHENGVDEFSEKYRKTEKSVLASRLLSIHAKIEERKKQWENSNKREPSNVSRHERELGLCVKPDSVYTKLLQFAHSCQPNAVDQRPPSHPINHLKNIADELFGHLAKKKRKTNNGAYIQSPTKFSTNSSLNVSEHSLPQCEISSKVECPNKSETSSLWDIRRMEEVPRTKVPMKSCETVRVYSCKPETLYTIRDKKIVPLDKPVNSGVIEQDNDSRNKHPGQTFVLSAVDQTSSFIDLKNKLSIEEIKSLPKFKNYEEGIPSKVLYIKNLASSVKEDDLTTIFGKFEDSDKPRISYRLMCGKMRGQAFVTFPSLDAAKNALDSFNGAVFKGKPIIIQYGRAVS